MQEEALEALWNVPIGHEKQDDNALTLAKLPGVHNLHDVCPVIEIAEPASQSIQSDRPLTG